MILVPVTSRRSNNSTPNDSAEDVEQAQAVSGCKPGYVFDLSQTDGEPLPVFAEVGGEQATISTR